MLHARKISIEKVERFGERNDADKGYQNHMRNALSPIDKI
jgi:hypothetical protein